MIDWQKLLTILEWRYHDIRNDKAMQFIHWVSYLVNAPHGWGKESPYEVDCSGTVCFALWMQGLNIRTTAEELRQKVFTYRGTPWACYDDPTVVFYVDRKTHKAIHVAPFVGRGVVLNAGDTAKFCNVEMITEWFVHNKNASAVYKSIDWDKAHDVSAGDSDNWDIDPLLKLLRDKE